MPTLRLLRRSHFTGPIRLLISALLGAAVAVHLHPVEVNAQDGTGDTDIPASGNGYEIRIPYPAGSYYGINFIQPHEPWLTLGRSSGAGIVRWQFNWRDHEISPGEWTWVASDRPIEAWNNSGLGVHAILHNPPDFAKANPSSGLVPTNLALPWNDPGNGWAQFCYQFASRYRGKIASYEIWNEPDLNQYWEGSPEEYFLAMKSCYLAIKAADPNPPVSMAGMAILIERGFLPEVIRMAASDPEGAAHNYYFDVANVHAYADPDLVYSLTQHVRSVLHTYGLGDKPIWVTETNVALSGFGRFARRDWGHVSEEEQAWYIIQAVANAHAAGAQRLMFFRLADDGMDEAFGLIGNDRVPRPSYRALQLATSLIHDVVQVRREIRQGVNVTYLIRSDGARIVVLYSEAGTALNFEVEASQAAAVLIDANGDYSTIRPEEGTYTVMLPPASGRDYSGGPGYAVGGPPLIIVEQDKEGPLASVEIISIPGEDDHLVVRWAGDDGDFGTGVESFDVEVSFNEGPWETVLAGTTESQTGYDILEDGRYSFRVRAVDRAGNFGEFSYPVSIDLVHQGTLLIEVTDLRGQGVPYARVTLGDGTLHDAGPNGVVEISAEPGVLLIESIDGSAQGRLVPNDPYEIQLLEEAFAAWMLTPLQDLITNGHFELGSEGWQWSAPEDVETTATDDPERGAVLRLAGSRRPWGSPSASTTVDIPVGWPGALLSFYYRVPEGEPILRVRAITEEGQATLWQSTGNSRRFERVWVDMSSYQGQRVTLVWELFVEKGGVRAAAEIDDVVFGNVPELP